MVYAWRVVKQELKKELELTSEEFEILIHPAMLHQQQQQQQIRHSQKAGEGGRTMTADGHPSNNDDRTVAVFNDGGEYHLEDGTGGAAYGAIEITTTEDLEEGEEWYWVWA
jgi:hypothetical protein